MVPLLLERVQYFDSKNGGRTMTESLEVATLEVEFADGRLVVEKSKLKSGWRVDIS